MILEPENTFEIIWSNPLCSAGGETEVQRGPGGCGVYFNHRLQGVYEELRASGVTAASREARCQRHPRNDWWADEKVASPLSKRTSLNPSMRGRSAVF